MPFRNIFFAPVDAIQQVLGGPTERVRCCPIMSHKYAMARSLAIMPVWVVVEHLAEQIK